MYVALLKRSNLDEIFNRSRYSQTIQESLTLSEIRTDFKIDPFFKSFKVRLSWLLKPLLFQQGQERKSTWLSRASVDDSYTWLSNYQIREKIAARDFTSKYQSKKYKYCRWSEPLHTQGECLPRSGSGGEGLYPSTDCVQSLEVLLMCRNPIMPSPSDVGKQGPQ